MKVAWEQFLRWLILVHREKGWLSEAADWADYVRAMVRVPAPADFPSSFGAAARWISERDRLGGGIDLVEDAVFRMAL